MFFLTPQHPCTEKPHNCKFKTNFPTSNSPSCCRRCQKEYYLKLISGRITFAVVHCYEATRVLSACAAFCDDSNNHYFLSWSQQPLPGNTDKSLAVPLHAGRKHNHDWMTTNLLHWQFALLCAAGTGNTHLLHPQVFFALNEISFFFRIFACTRCFIPPILLLFTGSTWISRQENHYKYLSSSDQPQE